MIVPVKLRIPKEYEKDIASGAIDISKAVLRDVNSGKIIKHTDLFVENKDALKTVDVKRLGKTGAIIGGIALVGFGVYKLIEKFNKDKEPQMPKCITKFHEKLNIYLDDASKGELNIESIENLLKAMEEVEKIKDPNVKIDFSTQEVRELLNSIYKFTTKLNKKDKNNKIKFKEPSKNSKDNIVCLKNYLTYQKELISVS